MTFKKRPRHESYCGTLLGRPCNCPVGCPAMVLPRPAELSQGDPATFTFQRRAGSCDGNESVDHPAHYGGADNPYEAIKVIEAWGLGFCLGNAVKYLSRAGKKGSRLEDLRKARWYIDREIVNEEKGV